jgi:hypothetical protein
VEDAHGRCENVIVRSAHLRVMKGTLHPEVNDSIATFCSLDELARSISEVRDVLFGGALNCVQRNALLERSTAHRGEHKTQRGVGVFIQVDIENNGVTARVGVPAAVPGPIAGRLSLRRNPHAVVSG